MAIARVRITADDAGVSSSIDKAIITLSEIGALSHAAVFLNAPRTVAMIEESTLLRLVPHLTLTYGIPISGVSSNTHLIKSNGNFVAPLDFYNGDVRKSIKRWKNNALLDKDNKYLTQELSLQLSYFKKLVGYQPDFITYHHDVDKILIDEYPNISSADYFKCSRHNLMKERESAHFEYRLYSKETSFKQIQNSILVMIDRAICESRLNKGAIAEIAVHPAYSMGDLGFFSIYSTQRVKEFEALSSNPVISLLSMANKEDAYYVFE